MGRMAQLAAGTSPGAAAKRILAADDELGQGRRGVNPRQRRGLLLIAIAALGLVVVFVLVAGYVADVRKEVDPKVGLLALAKPVAAHQAITDEMVKTVEMPERWAPPSGMRDPGELVGLVAATDLEPNTLLQNDMLIAPPQLAPGQRELAILVDAEDRKSTRLNSSH